MFGSVAPKSDFTVFGVFEQHSNIVIVAVHGSVTARTRTENTPRIIFTRYRILSVSVGRKTYESAAFRSRLHVGFHIDSLPILNIDLYIGVITVRQAYGKVVYVAIHSYEVERKQFDGLVGVYVDGFRKRNRRALGKFGDYTVIHALFLISAVKFAVRNRRRIVTQRIIFFKSFESPGSGNFSAVCRRFEYKGIFADRIERKTSARYRPAVRADEIAIFRGI